MNKACPMSPSDTIRSSENTLQQSTSASKKLDYAFKISEMTQLKNNCSNFIPYDAKTSQTTLVKS